jgi:N-acyl homoserine lactone hydrolase
VNGIYDVVLIRPLLSPIFKRTFRGLDEVAKGVNFEAIEGDTQIVEGVRVLYTPGHTPGGQSVMVDTEKGKAIICGMCSLRETFDPLEAWRQYAPVIAPGVHTNLFDTYESLMRIKKEADIVIPLHAIEFAEVDTIG